MNAQNLVDLLKNYGKNISVDFANYLLSEFDFDTYVQSELSHLSVEQWDKQSPINGVSADVLLKRPDFKNADIVYLVKKDGSVIYIQPHNPFEMGFVPVTSSNYDEITQRHLRQIAEQFALPKFLNDVINYLNENGY